MITVDIKINGDTILSVNANRIEDFVGKDKTYTYMVNGTGGKKIRHKYKKGAIQLAIQMLKVVESL